MASTALARARPRGLVFILLFIGSFVATLALTWPSLQPGIRDADPATPQRADSSTASGSTGIAPDRQSADAASGTNKATSLPLPPEQIRQWVDAGINAEDSEERSLAIEALGNVPVEQSLPALVQVLREDRDARSRLTAIAELARLPDTEAVRKVRPALLESLANDPDYRVATAARTAAGGDG